MTHITATRQQPDARSYWTMGRGDSERAFRAAVRHSALVRVLRIGIPIVVAIGFAAISLTTWLNPLRMLAKVPVDMRDMVVSGTKITMEQPRLSGYTRDSRGYSFSAKAAAQDLTKPDLVELKEIKAKVEMQDKTTIEMSANTGLYDTKNEVLKLAKDILLSSSQGYQGRLSEAVVDVRKSTVTSDKPVEVQLLNGTLNANRLEVTESGDLVRFSNGVEMVLMLNGDETPKAVEPATRTETPPRTGKR
ncbi:MAG TPA: LPS export ABC transporter periplasmic protein LptC [Pseudolabrys sp.]|nr:LPS export ABC transporter periplasmic protein LptC [Pseudolabrys sp.]